MKYTDNALFREALQVCIRSQWQAAADAYLIGQWRRAEATACCAQASLQASMAFVTAVSQQQLPLGLTV
jgi:hypothetical protein